MCRETLDCMSLRLLSITMAPSATSEAKQASSASSLQQQDIQSLIQELKQACRRPLFEEIVNQKHAPEERAISRTPKRVKRTDPRKSWQEVSLKHSSMGDMEVRVSCARRRASLLTFFLMRSTQLLADASTLAPFMTLHEFGTISRIAVILLFGFLLPTSTGNDFFTDAEHAQPQPTGSQTSAERDVDAFLNMTLEERLDRKSVV